MTAHTPLERELLAALKAVDELLGDDWPDNGELMGAAIQDMVAAAIAKAEGRVE